MSWSSNTGAPKRHRNADTQSDRSGSSMMMGAMRVSRLIRRWKTT
jgi:hypothetical protein